MCICKGVQLAVLSLVFHELFGAVTRDYTSQFLISIVHVVDIYTLNVMGVCINIDHMVGSLRNWNSVS